MQVCKSFLLFFYFSCSLQMRSVTQSRFPNLWYIQCYIVLFMALLKFHNGAAHFIDPYLEDIRSIRDFHPKKVSSLLLEPIQARLAHEPSMIQHESNVVEVRVIPPEGFPNFPHNSTTAIVRSVSSSVSEKIRFVHHIQPKNVKGAIQNLREILST